MYVYIYIYIYIYYVYVYVYPSYTLSIFRLYPNYIGKMQGKLTMYNVKISDFGLWGDSAGTSRRVPTLGSSAFNTWRFPEIGVPPNHPFSWHLPLNHPFGDTPFTETHYSPWENADFMGTLRVIWQWCNRDLHMESKWGYVDEMLITQVSSKSSSPWPKKR